MSYDVRDWVATHTETRRGALTPTGGTKAGSTQYNGDDGRMIAVVHETLARTADTGPGPGPRTLLTLQAPGRDDVEVVLAADVQLVW